MSRAAVEDAVEACGLLTPRGKLRSRLATLPPLLTVGVGVLALSLATTRALADGGTVTRTYVTEGTQGTFVVPVGVEQVHVVAIGGGGGSAVSKKEREITEGGLGARVEGELTVTPGSTLYVEVGFKGRRGPQDAGLGGGASDVRTAPRSSGLSPDDRLIVAGAGGGAGGAPGGGPGIGGDAGGAEGEEGEFAAYASPGKGGTQTHGGAAGGASELNEEGGCSESPAAQDGALETGGAGGRCHVSGAEGGGGGAGFYGGGGGGAALGGAGGGGGSSLVPTGGSFSLAEREGPQVQISYTQPANPPAVVTGAASELGRETATLNATVNPEDGEVSGCLFEYGTTEAYGSTAPCSPAPGAGIAPVEVSARIAGLRSSTAYHYRIVATNANGTSDGGDETFTTATHNPPTVTSVSPEDGPQAGGETLTISGSEFFDVTSVKFGSTPAEGVTVDSPESITAQSPAGSGTVSVTVTTAAGTSPAGGASFTFLPLPVVTELSPKKGPGTGGTSVQIAGSGFDSASTVSFGANAASSVTVNSPTSITAVSPPGTGTVDVTVTTPYAGTSAIAKKGKFKYKKVKTKM
ncbi:MAG TPA: IPT/TIG domain-containing protein [Solirubrobacteraceae bacterium]|nr:IPT/TIG domain-containing protein [Solirubrobacteraceae bacterium]